MNSPRRNYRFFIVVCLVLCALAAACGASGARQTPSPSQIRKQGRAAPTPRPEERAAYGPPARLGEFGDDAVDESSGVAASRANAGLYWTHNDTGDGPFLYAFDRQGAKRGVWRVAGAKADDWEDMAAGPGPERGRTYLYIGDIGDNDYARGSVVVYRVPEPAVTGEDAESSKKRARETAPAEAIMLKYPDGAHDAETLLVHPQTGDLYIVLKSLDPTAGVYKLAAPFDSTKTHTLARVGEVRAPGAPFGGFFTGGAVSPDGTRLVLCDYIHAYEMTLPAGAPAFDAVWKQPMLVVDLGERKHGEAVTYGPDGDTILATNEGRHGAIVEVKRQAGSRQ
jgi:hypothetical protein